MKAKAAKLMLAAVLALIVPGSMIWALTCRQPTTAKAAPASLSSGSAISGTLTSDDVWGPAPSPSLETS